jgi:ABC-type Na+ efflux pump permease subunit
VAFGVPAYFRAARCVARERAADTLAPLLLTSLSPAGIAFQKWLGVLLRGWAPLTVLLTAAGFAVAQRVLPAGGVALLAGGVLVMAGGLAAVGLAVSVWMKTPQRATGLAVGLITLAVCLTTLHLVSSDDPDAFELLARVCPPVAAAPYFADPAVRPGGFLPLDPRPGYLLRLWAEGVGAWAGVGGLAFYAAWRKLRAERAT